MSEEYTQEEAYVLGCLYGRGSIEEEQDGFKLILRFPHVPYDPVGEAIIEALLERKNGLTTEEMRQLPEIASKGVKNLGLKLNKLSKWHPPRVEVSTPLLIREGNIWKIYDEDLAKEYLKWQKKYHKREMEWMKFVIDTIQHISSFVASDFRYYFETGAFGHIVHIVECRIQPIAMKYLRDNYKLDVGDVYKHNSISDSDTIFKEYDKELQEWFVRGLADTIATIDRYIEKEQPFYRVQFSVINENTRLPVDICLLLQKYLDIPVHYIGWASVDEECRDEDYTKRGGRDHLVKVWVVNFEKKFNLPLFMHEQKKVEFEYALEDSKETLKSLPKLEKRLTPCPRPSSRKKYIEFCIKCGCRQIRNKQASLFDVL